MDTSCTYTGTYIFETLKSEILDLTIKPGEEIKEADICKRFSVTRPPVHTALLRLKDMALVTIKPYHGIHATLLDMDKVHQIIAMRSIVEAQILQDFISSKPDGFVVEELEHNIRLQRLMLKNQEPDRNAFFELDDNLHLIWFRHQHSETMWNIIQEQNSEYTRFCMLDYRGSIKYSDMVTEHEELLQAIKTRNKKNIATLIGMHLHNSLRRMGTKILNEYRNYMLPASENPHWTAFSERYYKHK